MPQVKQSNPPSKRIKDVTEARSLFLDLDKRDEQARKFRAQGRNQVEGGLPVDPLELKKQGRSWEFNSNLGIARADFEKAHLPYFRMVNEMPRKSAVTIYSEKPQVPKWQAAFESTFDRFIRDWGQNYVFNYLSMTTDFVGWGIGTVFFDKQKSPRWKAVNRDDVRVPKRSPHEASLNSIVGICWPMSLTELYGKINGASALAGWNEGPVKYAIMRAVENQMNDVSATRPGDWGKVQDRIRDNDVGVGGKCDMIDCAALLVKEFDESITMVIFERDQPTPKNDSAAGDNYLYEQKNFAKSMEEAIRFIVFEAPLGERTFHGIKGQIIKNYPYARTENRLWARMLNAAHFGLSMNFKGSSTAIREYPVRNFGNVNVFTDGLEQQQYYPQLQNAIALQELLKRNKGDNLASYKQGASEIANSETATAARLAAGIDASFNQATAALYLSQISDLFAEQYRRLRRKNSDDPDAKKFQDRLRKLGVPDEIIYEVEIDVATTAGAGAAAPWNRAQDLAQWASNRGSPLFNERWFLETQAAHYFGPEAVDKAVLQDDDPASIAQRRAAIQENVDMGQGVPLDAVAMDDHIQHIGAHFQPLMGMIGAAESGGQADPQKAVVASVIMGHLSQHLQFLANDEAKRPQFKQLTQAFTQIEGKLENMIKAASQSPAAMAGQPQPV